MDLLKILLLVTLLTVPTGEVIRFNFARDLGINLIDILVSITGLYGYSYLLINKIPLSKKWKYFFSFIAIGTLSLLFNLAHYTEKGLINSFLYTIRLVLLFSIIPLISIQKKEFKNTLAKVLFFDGVLFIGLGFLQLLFYPSLRNLMYLGWDVHYYRIFSTFLDPNFAAIFISLFIIFLIPYIKEINRKSLKDKILMLFLAFSSLIALIFTYSRSALVSMLIPAVAFLFAKNKILIITFIIVLGISYLIFLKNTKHQGNIGIFRINSINARLQSAGFAISVIKDSPIIGIGLNGYRYYLEKKLSVDNSLAKVPTHGSSPDTSLLFVYATSGILGFIFYLGFWYEIVKEKRRGKSLENRVILVGTIVLFTASIFTNALFYVPIMVWFLAWLGIAEARGSK